MTGYEQITCAEKIWGSCDMYEPFLLVKLTGRDLSTILNEDQCVAEEVEHVTTVTGNWRNH